MIILGCPMITLGFSCSGGEGVAFFALEGGGGVRGALGGGFNVWVHDPAHREDERALMILLDAALPRCGWGRGSDIRHIIREGP